MNREELKEYAKKADELLYGFYARSVYRMGEHPALFWAGFFLAVVGGGALIVWAL